MSDPRTAKETASCSASPPLVAMLGLLFGGCGPGPGDEPNPWGTLEIAYLASPTIVDDVMTRELRVTDVDGAMDVAVEHARLVTSDAVAWSPDGKRIAYVGELLPPPNPFEVATSGGLFAVDRQGEELVAEILDTMGYGGSSPAVSWSPRGDRIALVRSGRSWAFQCQMRGLLLLVVDIDPEAPADDGISVQESDVAASAPAWAPDGDSVAVGAEHLICGDEREVDSFSWNVHLCGGERGCLVSYGPSTDDIDEWLGAWSPDGDWLAVSVGTRYGPTGSTQLHLWTADGNSSIPLTSGECSHEGAVWFPDGDRLLTRRSCQDAAGEHVVLDVDTGDVEDVLPDLGASVSIAPEGTRLLHVTDDDPPRIAIYDMEDDRVTVLADGEAPVWRPR